MKFKQIFFSMLMLAGLMFSVSAQCDRTGAKSYFRLQPAAQKAALWQNHLRDVLRSEDLSDVQRGTIIAVKNSISSDTFEEGSDNAYIESLAPTLTANFTKQQQVKFFHSLSLEEVVSSSIVPVSYTKTTSLKLMSLDECDCSHVSALLCDACPKSDGPFGLCQGVSIGCGLLWAFRCDGICTDMPPPPGEGT